MILALEEAKYRLENFRADITELGSALRIEDLRQKVKDLEATTSDAAFWNDQETSGKTLREIKRLKDKIHKFEALSAKLEDTITLAELAIEENDESLIGEVETAEKEIREEEETQRIEILLSGEYDQNNAILSFHPGAGGTEAQDWA
ncbi:MAG: PCRF domain-containing protein, partial [Clostridia bacterium]|nr:PCRF domain-containing protein [Clostridia bacterium]